MTTGNAVHNPEEFTRRAQAFHDQNIRPALRPEDADKFVAIDIDSGNFELDRDDFAATERLLARQPQAQIWLARVGRRAAYRIGGHSVRGEGA